MFFPRLIVVSFFFLILVSGMAACDDPSDVSEPVYQTQWYTRVEIRDTTDTRLESHDLILSDHSDSFPKDIDVRQDGRYATLISETVGEFAIKSIRVAMGTPETSPVFLDRVGNGRTKAGSGLFLDTGIYVFSYIENAGLESSYSVLVAINEDLDILWQATLPSPEGYHWIDLQAVGQGPSGGLFLGGGIGTSVHSETGCLIKVSANSGEVEWTQVFSGINCFIINDLVVVENEIIWVGQAGNGEVYSSIVVKTDFNGQVNEIIDFPEPEGQLSFFRAIQWIGNADYIVGGDTWYSMQSSNAWFDVRKISSVGEVEWQISEPLHAAFMRSARLFSVGNRIGLCGSIQSGVSSGENAGVIIWINFQGETISTEKIEGNFPLADFSGGTHYVIAMTRSRLIE
jgi:hypothetical protein